MLLNKNETYTFEEYLEISKNERCEFIDGKIFMMGSPSIEHQRIVGKLFVKLSNYFNGKICEPFISPLDVVLSEKKIVQPDLFVVCDKDNLKDNRYEGVPRLVIEVVSPSNSSYDYVNKLDLYTKAGVQEYWIINPAGKDVLCYQFENNGITDFQTYTLGGLIESKIFEKLAVSTEELFEYK
jgi:Uma2 family endonuclease